MMFLRKQVGKLETCFKTDPTDNRHYIEKYLNKLKTIQMEKKNSWVQLPPQKVKPDPTDNRL